MVPIKPHIVSVQQTTQTVGASSTLGAPATGSASAQISVYMEAKTPGEAYAKWGIELRQPYVLLCEIADATAFTPDCVVTRLDTLAQFAQRGRVAIYDAGDVADHAEILLDRLQVGPAS